MTMSLDGYIAGPNISVQNPLGEDGEQLHDWLFDKKTKTDAAISKERTETSGAVIVGFHTYETAIDEAWGGKSPFDMPAFVVTASPPEKIVQGFTFVDGIEVALAQARKTAKEKNVWVMGGANVVQQFIKAGLFDELSIHVAPVILQKGTRLFDNTGEKPQPLELIQCVHTPGAVHLVYRMANRVQAV